MKVLVCNGALAPIVVLLFILSAQHLSNDALVIKLSTIHC